MAHLTVYRHDMTPDAWPYEKLYSGLGRLPDAVLPRTKRAINGEWAFTMRYPLTGANYDQLEKGRLICAEGQLYRIARIKKSDRAAGREVQVDAYHIFYDLKKVHIINIETSETDLDGITQQAALQQILAGTPFTVGTVDDTTTLDYLDILQKSAFWALQEQVIKLWGGELQPDNWTLNIRAQIGLDRRFPIRRGMNIRGIDYTEDITNLVTRLHVAGYGGATFEDINGGKDYIDSPYIDNYRYLGSAAGLEDQITFDDDDQPEVLLEKGQAHLATVDVPQVSYDIDLLEIRNSVQYELYRPLLVFGLGDSAVVHHDFFNMDITARALQLERDPVLEENIGVELGNYQKDLYSTLASTTQAAKAIEAIIGRGGSLRGEKLRGTIDLLVTQLKASGSYANATVLERQGFLTENTNADSPDYGATYIGCGIWALANEKNADNSWSWRTFGTPRGFTGQELIAESVTANKLAADVAQSLELSSNESIKAVVQAAINAEHGALQAYAQTLLTNHDWSVEIGQAKQAAIEIANGGLDSFVQWVKGWMTFDGMTLSLGRSDSAFKTRITNSQLAFTYGGTTLAYFAYDRLVVPWAEFEKITMMARNAAGNPSKYLDIQFDGTSYYGNFRG